MHGTVQIRDLFNFFLCCCLPKGTIFHRFLMFVLFTSFYHSGYFGVACVIYLRDCKAQNCSPKPWLGIAIRQVNYNQAPQVKNLNNTKKGKGEKSSRKIPKSRSCPLQAMVAHVLREISAFISLQLHRKPWGRVRWEVRFQYKQRKIMRAGGSSNTTNEKCSWNKK